MNKEDVGYNCGMSLHLKLSVNWRTRNRLRVHVCEKNNSIRVFVAFLLWDFSSISHSSKLLPLKKCNELSHSL